MFFDFRAPTVALSAILSLLAVGSVSAQELSGPGRTSIQLQQKVETTFIVKFDDTVNPSLFRRNAASLATQFSGRVVHVYENVFPGFAIRVNEDGGARLLAAAGQFGIASVSRDAIVSISANSEDNPGSNAKPCFVTDTCEPSGGGGDGQTIGWNIARVTGGDLTGYGSSTITACVIDTGIDSDHEDLNVGPGTSFISDSSEDDNGHGTHVAGTIGAKNNTVGVLGVAPGVKVVPVKVLDASGSGSLADVVAGIDWTVDKCTIANLSLGASTTNTTMDDAIKAAAADGVLFSIAAGNSSVDIIDGNYTPARASVNSSDNIFTIAAIAQNDEWSSFSNFHFAEDPRVDFALPGSSILSTWNDGGYNTISGTSMAAPHMAGLLVRYIKACQTTSTCPSGGILTDGEFFDDNTSTVTRATSERIKDGPGKPKTTTVEHESYYIVDLPFP